jgi:4-amino-4-deoxy-L-arabinose transferase-like glycosyltransferase
VLDQLDAPRAADSAPTRGTAGRGWSPQQLLALLGLLVVSAYVHLGRLAAVEWKNDEVGYRNAGVAYTGGDFTLNREHPFLVKYLYGVAERLLGDGSPTAVRAVSGVAAILTGLVLVALVRQVAGIWTGLLAGMLWTVLPHPVQLGVRADSVAPKLERLASLEALTVLFLVVALHQAWQWAQRGSWRAALLCGAALGAAGGSKAAAVVAVPALVGLVLWFRLRRNSAQVLLQVAAGAAAAVLVLLLSYAPDAAGTVGHLQAILDNASAQSAGGHAVVLADQRYESAPWWALLYWQWAGQGTVVTAVLALLCALAPWQRRLDRRLVWSLLAAVAVPLAWFSLVNGFILSHYASLYQPPLAVLAALVVGSLVRDGGRRRALGVLLGGGLVVAAAAVTVGYVAGHPRDGYSGLEQAAELLPPDAAVAVSGNPFTVAAYLPDARVTAAPAPGRAYDAVVVDRRQAVSPQVQALLARARFVPVLETPAAQVLVRSPG